MTQRPQPAAMGVSCLRDKPLRSEVIAARSTRSEGLASRNFKVGISVIPPAAIFAPAAASLVYAT
jgi:hypothetical protein